MRETENEPNQALEPTTMAVTLHAPSRMKRASHGRGSSITFGNKMKKPRQFSARSPEEQQMLTYDSWCDTCNQADLGIREPQEFEENGEIIVEGLCKKCGGTVRNIITETIIKRTE